METVDRTDQGSEVRLEIKQLSAKGEGIAFFNGDEIYLKGVLPEEVVLARLGPPFVPGSQRRPAEVLEIESFSSKRNQHPCPYVKDCGGCTLGLYNYSSQLELKAQDIRTLLSELKLSATLLSRMQGQQAEQVWRYKSLRYFESLEGRLRQGFYAPRSHQLCPIDSCQAEPAWMSEFACALEEQLQSSIVPVRALLMRDLGEHRLVVLICPGRLAETQIADLRILYERFSLSSLQQLIHEHTDNALMRGELLPLYGSAYVQTELLGLKFEVGAQTFLQVNPAMAEQMYQEVVQFCKEAPEHDEALDLCCGVGTMSLMLAQHFSRVSAVDIVPQSIQAARENARLNGLTNLNFTAADLSAVLAELINPAVDAVICDPARVGIGEHNCKLLGRLKSGCRLCYIFCSLKALRRDLPCLIKAGFTVQKVTGYDMFPYTRMQETVVYLIRR